MRLRGPHLIGQANLNTAVSSQSGTIPALQLVPLMLNPYSFVMDTKTEIPGTLGRFIPWIGFPPLLVDADAPLFGILNQDPSAILYAAEWRHIEP